MVSLSDKDEFLGKLREVPLANDLVELLSTNKVTRRRWNRSLASDVASESLYCLAYGNKTSFKKIYADFTRRNPDAETDWIYDDFVLFSLVCSVKKFQQGPTWLNKVIALRKDLKRDSSKNLPATFLALLSDNTNSKEVITQVVVAFDDVVGGVDIDESRINVLFDEIWQSEFPSSPSQFLNLINLHAYGSIIRRKGLNNVKRNLQIMKASQALYRRTRFVAFSVGWVLFISLISALIWLVSQAIANPANRVLNIILSLLGIVGIGVGESQQIRKKVSKLLQTLMLRGLGFWVADLEHEDEAQSSELADR